jgi:hypothetical protein
MNFIVSWVLDLFKKPELTISVEPAPIVKKVATKRKPAAKKSTKKTTKKVK